MRRVRLAFAVALAACAAGGAATAQPAEAFFKGKTINLYIGFAPGGTYDYYSRLFARFIGRHIPGSPSVVAQNMPGAGSFLAANFLYAVAPKDGTALAMITQAAAVEEALASPGVKYKSAEFNWIGRVSDIVEIHFTWKTSKAKTLDEATRFEIPLAGTGPGSPSEGYPRLLNALAGTRFRVISGYPGSTQGMVAMERGEVDGALTSWHTLVRTRPEWLRNRDINLLVQYAPERHRDVPDVPTALEVVRTPEGRAMMAFFISSAQIGRAIAAPPGVPAERVALLRAAFEAMLKDPDLLAEIEKSGLEFGPASGAAVQKVIQDTIAAPRDIVEKTQAIVRK